MVVWFVTPCCILLGEYCTIFLEGHSVSIFRVEVNLQHRKWKQYLSLERCYPPIILQKSVISHMTMTCLDLLYHVMMPWEKTCRTLKHFIIQQMHKYIIYRVFTKEWCGFKN